MPSFRSIGASFLCLGFLTLGMLQAGPTYNVQVFATGAAVNGSSPDSVSYGNGSVWVAYQNGANSAGASGSSTVVRYSPAGAVQHSWTIGGNVDGLRVDPSSGLVWALQNNDGNSALTVINPTTNATTAYTYGNTYTNVPNRGFDDVVFSNGSVYISETNPAGGSDPVVWKLTSGLGSPLQVSPILKSTLTGTNLATGLSGSTTITDSDSLELAPGGALALTGEADQQIAFIYNAGLSTQYEKFISLLGTNGQTISGLPDDTIYPNATGGLFYFADTGANKVYQVEASGLASGSVYIDVGNEFGILDTNTGIVTPIFTGTSPHGADFVSFADAGVPEPTTVGYGAVAILLGGALVYRRRSLASARS
jgi:hypothetical protein